MTPEQLSATYGPPPASAASSATPTQSTGTLSSLWGNSPKPQAPGAFGGVASDSFDGTPTGKSANIGGQIKDAFTGGISQMGEGIQEAKPNGKMNAGNLVEGTGKIVGGAAQAITSPLAPVLNPTVGAGINAAGNALSNTPYMQGYGKDLANQAPNENNTPEKTLSTIANYANAAGTVAGGEESPDVANTVKDSVQSDIEKGGTTKTPDTETDTAIKRTTQEGKIAKDWEKPTTQTKAGYKNATTIFKKDPTVTKFLGEQHILPQDNIDTSGKSPVYDTKDTASDLRNTAAKLSNEGLRPSLQHADYTTPKTSIEEIRQSALNNAKKEPNVTDDDRETLIKNVNSKMDSLGRANPNGMSLTDMHDGKITYANNGGYSPLKSASDNLTSTANRNIASALQKTVEDKAPSEINVGDFNQYLSKYYKAADYLEALHTKAVPYSALGYIAHRGAQLAGALGAHALGGGILSDVAGYSIGGALEHALSNLSNPVKASFIRNLEITNPDAALKVQKYLQEQSSGNTGIPRLNSPTAVQMPGESVRPIMGRP